MNNLPPELLQFVFTKIPLNDRLNCTLECRQWNRALQQRSLLYDIDIHHKKGLDNLIELLQCRPSLATQVEILKFVPCGKPINFDCRRFCNMFPNLHVFINSCYNRPNKKYFNRPFEIAIPVSKVEEIEDRGECELTRQLLLSVPCKHL
jgi:hypothetical protein